MVKLIISHAKSHITIYGEFHIYHQMRNEAKPNYSPTYDEKFHFWPIPGFDPSTSKNCIMYEWYYGKWLGFNGWLHISNIFIHNLFSHQVFCKCILNFWILSHMLEHLSWSIDPNDCNFWLLSVDYSIFMVASSAVFCK